MVEKPVQQCKNFIQLKIKIVEAQAPSQIQDQEAVSAGNGLQNVRRLLAMDSKTGADIRALRAALRAGVPSWAAQLLQEPLDMV